jgi:hypothetical protein
MKRRISIVVTLLAAVAAWLALTAQAPAATGGCRVSVTNIDGNAGNEVKALELNEKEDDIFLRIDGVRFPSNSEVEFSSAPLGKPASAFGNPSRVFNADEEIKMEVVEKDPLFNDNMGVSFIRCAPLTSTLVFNDGSKGAYTVEVKVEEI